MRTKNKLIDLCEATFKEKNLDEKFRNRLNDELREIDSQNEYDYFLTLHFEGKKFPQNENNLLVPFLLGLVDDFNLSEDPVYIYGEMPDLDIDYIGPVRDYLKNEWAPKTFGADKVCNIGNYTQFGIKSSLLDMARVYGADYQEVQAVSNSLGLKDADGKSLTWEKAIEESEELAQYCQSNPDIADATKRLVSRNRGRGKHAGGLIISSVPLDNFVPLLLDEDKLPVSAWAEGLHSQDLGPVGLIKFDLLTTTTLIQIAMCCKLIKERHGIQHICAQPIKDKDGNIIGMDPDWTDLAYLDDPKAIALARTGALKGIFQFDSDGIRNLVKRCNVDNFEDLVAISALYRPGPRKMKMHDHYVNRKNGKEMYEIHPLLESSLAVTYGVLCYQEQVMRVLNVVGDIPLKDCEMLRKAISKKKEKIFIKYKEQFVANGQVILGWNEESLLDLWDQIAAFADYGFNRAHATAYTYTSSRLLWLKAHYPIEFYTALLIHEKDSDNLKDYKLDAAKFGIDVLSADINCSDVNFAIHNENIYIGFEKIKGIGEGAAQRMVANRPYHSFQDFLTKFGTEAGVVKPILGLRLFPDAEPEILYEYYEYFKDYHKKIGDRRKRNKNSREKAVETLKANLPQALADKITYEFMETNYWKSEEDFFKEWGNGDAAQIIFKGLKKYRKSVQGFDTKESNDKLLSLEEFQPTGEIEPELKEFYTSGLALAEQKFYGFTWNHILRTSPDYDATATLSKFEKDESLVIGNVQVHVVEKPIQKQSKKGATYYNLKIEDSNGQAATVTIWNDDFDRFKSEFEYWESDVAKGNWLSLRLKRPNPGFNGFTFESPPKHLRYKLPKKELDSRLLILRKPCQK